MGFDPKDEPCPGCGREVDECLCGLAPDFVAISGYHLEQYSEEIEEDEV